MVLLTTTPQILNLISTLPPALLSTLEAAAAPDDLPENETAPISHKALISLSKILRHHQKTTQDAASTLSEPVTLDNLLRGTKVYKPPPPAKPTPTAEYVALMERLRAEEERKQYISLLAQQNAHDGGKESDDESQEDPISPSLVLNILLSVIFCAIAVFYATRWWAKDGVRVLVSLAAGIVVGVAEVVVYAGYVRNVKRGRAKERMKKERKVMVGEFVGGEGVEAWGKKMVFDSVGDRGLSQETELIWGKGKHGGMRRRVREKWEKETAMINEGSIET